MDYILDFFRYIINQFASMHINDIIDILLVSVLFYYIYIFIRDRRAGKLALGVVFIILILLFSNFMDMHTLSFLLQNIVQVGLLALVVVFQPELRSMLEKLGGNSLNQLNRLGEQKELQQTLETVDELARSAQELSNDKTGALIVIERSTRLGDEVKSGVVVDAEISSFIIKNIFFNKAPLHDGAMIIRNNRILACGCFLPLSNNSEIIKDLGTRHRAGIGISENSDAIVIVVSEENGVISLAENGSLVRGFTRSTLKNELLNRLVDPTLLKKGADEAGPQGLIEKIKSRVLNKKSDKKDK